MQQRKTAKKSIEARALDSWIFRHNSESFDQTTHQGTSSRELIIMSEFDKGVFCEAAGDDTAVAICASFDYTDAAVAGVSSGLDVFYLLFAGAMVFFMQSGFAMLCAGSIRQK
ncbi:hypothetical protein THAOC_26233, partial [Thalassiosira oceanica]